MGLSIALATSREWHGLAPSDALLASALRERGHDARAVVWDDTEFSWQSADVVVIRSCWDYHLRVDDFLRWAGQLPVVVNPASLVAWNARKTYLFDLADRGVPTVPTLRVVDDLVDERLFDAFGADRLVVKPLVGASSHRLFIANRGESHPVDDVLVQPYQEAIEDGEWSLVMIDGALAHAIVKKPRQGDFRVQSEYGGSAERAVAPPHLRHFASRVLRVLPEVPAYARVDLIDLASGPILMELELIEPELFLTYAPSTAPLLCDAIEKRA